MPPRTSDDSPSIAADWFWETGADLRLTYVSPKAEAALGYPAAELLGLAFGDISDTQAWSEYRQACAARRSFRDVFAPWSEGLAGTRWIRISGEPRLADDGTWLGFRGVGIAVEPNAAANRARSAQARLIEQNRLFDAALENMSQGLCMFDHEQRLMVFNSRYCEIFGIPAAALRVGMTQVELIEQLFARNTYALEETVERLQANAQTSIQSGGTIAAQRVLADGRTVSVLHRPMTGGGWVATFEDVTERRKSEERIAHLARYDALTDLANRSALYETTCRLADGVRHQGGVMAVFALSLRRFKLVNDGLGAPIGDLLLRSVAHRLRSMTTGIDTVARVGGDEFAVIQLFPSEAEALAFAPSLISSLQMPFVVADETVTIGVSVGIALWDQRDGAIDHVLKNAGLAMDSAKADGVGSLRLFEQEMDASARERSTMERDIDAAFSLGQFEVHYQPILEIESRSIIGLEALVRWRHPIRGLVSPGAFIPVLEESGLIVPLGQWVLDQACHDAAGWPGEANIAVNVSAVQLRHADFASAVMASLAASGLPPHRLELEITESVLLDEGDTSHETLHRLQRAGIRISMDDFGTGYSSLSYLRSFPFDKIKIDQSFVRDAPRKADALAIVRAIVGLGQSLGIRTLAEGIETEEQLAVIRAEGCSEMQGFLFSAARPAAEIAAMLGTQEPLTKAA